MSLLPKPHHLSKLKIREISLVDAPASPGANAILSKRRAGARDARGNFASGAGEGHQVKFSLTHAERTALEGEMKRREGEGNPMRHLDEVHSFLDYHRSQSKGRHDVVATIGKANFDPTEPRDTSGRWVAGPALAASAAAYGAGHALSHHPNPFVQAAGHALKFGGGVAGATAISTNLRTIKPVKGGIQFGLETKIPGKPAVRTSVNLKPGTFRRWLGYGDQAADKIEGTAHPTNGLPIVTTRSRTAIGTPIPLNHPNTDWKNAGGWPYRTKTGEFVPAGSGEQQKYIEEAQAARAISQLKLPVSSYAHSGGDPYMTAEGHVIPGGSREAQNKMEARYALERDRGLLTKNLMLKPVSIFKSGQPVTPFSSQSYPRLQFGAMRLKTNDNPFVSNMRAARSVAAGPSNRRAFTNS